MKVLDFGLVKALDDGQEESVTVTADNDVRGTPGFIAPEQVLGQHELDHRVDIYALGCVAYWLVTGQLVFGGDTPMALLMHHVHTVPPAPSTRTELPIPPALDRLVLSCLAKNRADRPQSAKELGRQLLALDGIGGWTAEDARLWWAEHLPGSGRRTAADSLTAEDHQVVSNPSALQT